MTVQELIDRLKNYPADALVLVSGYESDFDEATDVLHNRVEYDKQTESYLGDYKHSPKSKLAVVIASMDEHITSDQLDDWLENGGH